MSTSYSITEAFGTNLAEILSSKIIIVYPKFDSKNFILQIKKEVVGKTYTQRIEIFAHQLKLFLPADYKKAIKILLKILGEENPNETGMFTHYYWIMPIGKFISIYGLDHFELSIEAIAEVTKRNTGEYAIRPFIEKYPKETVNIMKSWAKSDNFHLRRLACEGLRPKLPWAPKLDTFNDKPKPVFEILDILKKDEIMFVKKSVANHLTDWLKVNKAEASKVIKSWEKIDNVHTAWIIKRATRRLGLSKLKVSLQIKNLGTLK